MNPNQPTFAARLEGAMAARGQFCVGVDPHAQLLRSWGLSDDFDGLRRFCDICTEAFTDTAAVVKPQSAFFERFGSAGVSVLERLVTALRAGGALVLLDVKRGDIGSTMAAYAQAYLEPAAPLSVDAITVSPYLGVGSLQPAFELAATHGRGVFVLALTSNPEGPSVQHAHTPEGRLLAQAVLDEIGTRNAAAVPFGSIGAVVGATIKPGTADFSGVNGMLLAPGVGAQGGTVEAVRRIFGDALHLVLPTSSREVLAAGPGVAALGAALARQQDAFAFLRG